MADSKKIGDAALAQRVIEAYADLDGLTGDECRALRIGSSRCEALCAALESGEEGFVTDDERRQLFDAGFSKKFIDAVAGSDGAKALMRRARSLADSAIKARGVNDGYEFVKVLAAVGDRAVPALIDVLKDGGDCRHTAAEALGKIGPAAKPAIPALIAALDDKSDHLPWQAAYAISRIDPSAKEAVTPMVRALDRFADVDDNIREFIAEALSYFGPAAAEAVPSLMRIYNTGFCLETIIRTLGKIGPAAAPALPDLLRLLKKKGYTYPKSDVVVRAAAQIGKPAELIPVFIGVIYDNQDEDARKEAAGALGRMGEATFPFFFDLLKNGDPRMSYLATYGFGEMGEPAVDRLVALLDAGEPAIVMGVAEALGEIGKPAARALPRLLELAFDDESHGVRRAALRAMAKIGGAEFVPALTEGLHDVHPNVRFWAAKELGDIGGGAWRALKLLEIMSERDPEPKCRSAAANAVVKIMEGVK